MKEEIECPSCGSYPTKVMKTGREQSLNANGETIIIEEYLYQCPDCKTVFASY